MSSAILTPSPPPPLVVPNVGSDVSGFIAKYVKIRFAKKQIQDRHKAELRPYNDMIEALETGFLGYLQGANTDSASARGVGTVYTTTKRSATIADAAEFRRFVIGAEQWDLVDWRANAPQVAAFMEANATSAPPGVNYSERQEVGIRKA